MKHYIIVLFQKPYNYNIILLFSLLVLLQVFLIIFKSVSNSCNKFELCTYLSKYLTQLNNFLLNFICSNFSSPLTASCMQTYTCINRSFVTNKCLKNSFIHRCSVSQQQEVLIPNSYSSVKLIGIGQRSRLCQRCRLKISIICQTM